MKGQCKIFRYVQKSIARDAKLAASAQPSATKTGNHGLIHWLSSNREVMGHHIPLSLGRGLLVGASQAVTALTCSALMLLVAEVRQHPVGKTTIFCPLDCLKPYYVPYRARGGHLEVLTTQVV